MDPSVSLRRDLSYGLIIRNHPVAGYQAALEIPQLPVATAGFCLSNGNYNIFVYIFALFDDILLSKFLSLNRRHHESTDD
jgi:hypothetical protein